MGRETPQTQIQRFLRWFTKHGVSAFDLAIARRSPKGTILAFLSPSVTGHQNLSVHQLRPLFPWLRAENARGADIYFRPSQLAGWPVVFLDDLPLRWAQRISGKYAAAVVETSPSCCHVWIATTTNLDTNQRFLAQKFLIHRLDGLADPNSASGDHWGRLPGFRNHKPNRNAWVNLRMTSCQRPWSPVCVSSLPSSSRLQPIQNPKHDPSRLEWGWVMGALENHLPQRLVFHRLIQRASQRRGHTDATRYASLTLRKACLKLRIPFLGPFS